MEKLYLEKLYIDYCCSIGKKLNNPIDIDNKDFKNWLILLEKYTQLYKDYIKNFLVKKSDTLNPSIDNLFRVEPTGKSIIELNKGKYDSTSSMGTVVVSQYASTLGLKNAEFGIFSSKPKLVIENKTKEIEVTPTIISHNEGEEIIKKLSDASNLGLKILYGVYGSNNDKNQEEKISQVLSVQDVLSLDGEVEFYRDSDIYCCTIRTTGKSRIRK